MNKLSETTRIAISLASLTVTVLLTGSMVGLIPESRDEVMKGRSNLCEAVAINFSLLAQRGDLTAMEASLHVIANRNEDILSIGVRRDSGDVLIQVGDHEKNWKPESGKLSTETQMFVPVSANSKSWGTVEFRFRPVTPPGFWGIIQTPLVSLTLFTGAAGYLIYLVYLRKVLSPDYSRNNANMMQSLWPKGVATILLKTPRKIGVDRNPKRQRGNMLNSSLTLRVTNNSG